MKLNIDSCKRSSFGWALLFLLASCSASIAQIPAPPATWPKTVIVTVCPNWENPRGHNECYRTCYDRPVATGTLSSDVWQLTQLQKYLPGAVMAVDLIPRKDNSWPISIFTEYLEAARQVPGARVMPFSDVSLPGEPDLGERENALFDFFHKALAAHRDDPAWFHVAGVPVVIDYAHGGMGFDSVTHLAPRFAQAGDAIYWLTDVGATTDWTVPGRVDGLHIPDVLQSAAGVYTFGPPSLDSAVNTAFANFAKAVRSYPDKRIYGAVATNGYYSAREAQRNYVSARGTFTFRNALDHILPTDPDFLTSGTWNDYVEAGTVEPSYKHTSALMEILRSYEDDWTHQAHVSDTQPHIIVSYRKIAYPGQPIQIEVLNLPVAQPFTTIQCTINIRNAAGVVLAKLPVALLSGLSRSAQSVTFNVPPFLGRDMLQIEATIEASGAARFHRDYVNLPPIPVVTDGVLQDPLYFNVPLHRLRAEKVQLTIDGTPTHSSTEVTSPVLLGVQSSGGAQIEGVSYMKDGAVIDEPAPETATSPVLDNWMPDPTLPAPPRADYYGALVQYKDGSMAYTTGAWRDDASDRVWLNYDFMKQDTWAVRKLESNKIRDISGHGLNGTLIQASPSHGKLPAWAPVGYMHDALAFDGAGSMVDLGITAFPVGPVTIELLIKPDVLGRKQDILVQGGDVASIVLESGGTLSVSRTNDARLSDTARSAARLTTNKWTYVVATYDMQTLRLYVDGHLDAQVASDGVKSTEGAHLGGPFWGASASGELYAGQIARFRVLMGASSSASISRDAASLLSIYNGTLSSSKGKEH